MGTFRKLAREAVIFMLLGPVVTGLAAFVYLKRQSAGDIKADAARGVYAIDAAFEEPRPPVGFTPVNSVLVPLTNGMQLYVTDCAQAHPWVVVSETPAKRSAAAPVPIPPGATNGSDCVYFTNKFSKLEQKSASDWVDEILQPKVVAVPLGDENQIAIEQSYWLAYVKSKHEHLVQSALQSVFLSLWGFPGGLLLWVFYRLVRFAVKG